MIGLYANSLALATGRSTSFTANGGTGPYVYSVQAGGAGGTVDMVSGYYTAPSMTGVDTVIATDALGAQASLVIKVCTAIELVCDILQNELGLASGRVYLYNQKINQPKDFGLYIAVGVLTVKVFGNSATPISAGGGLSVVQSCNLLTTLSLDVISRGTDALYRKEEIILALSSNYSQSQQELNGFYVGKIPAGSQFANLSQGDGAAIPYRFNVSVNVQHFFTKTKAVTYFDTFANAQFTPNL